MHRPRVVRWWRARLITYALHVGRPADGERLAAPNLVEQGPIWPLRGAVDRTRDVRQAHFYRIGRRALRLFRRGIAQPAASGAHVPEIAADKVALSGIIVQHWGERRISMRLRLAIAEAGAYRPGIGSGRPVEFRDRTRETGFRHVAERACLVAVYRELLVVEHQLSEQLDLLHLVVGRRGEPRQRLCLDAVDLGLHLRDLRQCLRGEHRLLCLRSFLSQSSRCPGGCDEQNNVANLHHNLSPNRAARMLSHSAGAGAGAASSDCAGCRRDRLVRRSR
jgi:hypothetical protein